MHGFRRQGRDLLMSSDETVLSVKNLSKYYEIYEKPSDRLKQFILPKIARLFFRTPKKYYQEFAALNNVSFDIKKGEAVGIIGRNGSGKSTLLQIICGTLTSTAGLVASKGRIAALLELGSGFNPEFTGRENVRLNAMIMGLSAKQVDEKMTEILKFAEIGVFIDQPVRTYSSGMFMRLAFAVQAHLDPEILVIDEALAVGDSYFVHRCMHRFNQLKAAGSTIILVSHDAASIRALCDRVIWINNGISIMDSNPIDVTDRYLATLFNQTVVTEAFNSNQNKSDAQGVERLSGHELLIPNIDLRTGNQECSILGLGLYDPNGRAILSTKNDEEIILRISLKNNSGRAINPVVGYTIRNFHGQDIASSDSSALGMKLDELDPEQIATYRFVVKLPLLHPGSYSISPSAGKMIASNEAIETDRVLNSIVFQITSEMKINLGMTFKTEISIERVYGTK